MKIVSNIAEKTNSSMSVSVEMLLRDAIKDTSPGGKLENSKKVLILTLNDDDQFTVNYFNAGMKASECVALLDIAKNIFKTDMHY